MTYYPISCNDAFDADIIHSALILEWNFLTDRIKASSDFDTITSYCKQLVRVLEMIRSMELDA